MPISYPLPPWVGKPADPAAHYATGFQMGMRLGAEQAANIYRTQQQQREQQIYEQQMARDLQKQEYERQLKEQQIALQVDEVTRKHQAIADYQGLVQQGMDPMQALQQVGPDLGVSPVAAYQASEAAQAHKTAGAELAKYHAGILAARQQKLQADAASNVPVVSDIDGERVIYNPKTGRFQTLTKKLIKEKFMSDHLNSFTSRWGSKAMDKLEEAWNRLNPDQGGNQSQQGVDLFNPAIAQPTDAGAQTSIAPQPTESPTPQAPRPRLRWDDTAGKLVRVESTIPDETQPVGIPEDDEEE